MKKNRSTPRRRRILSWLSVVLLVCVVFGVILLLGLGYLYQHPSLLARWLQAGFARQTGLSLVIGELNYTLNPGSLSARYIRIHTAPDQDDDLLSIGRLRLEFNLSGPWGKRRLTIDRLQLENVVGHLRLPWQGLTRDSASKSTTALNRLLLRTFRFFVFSAVHWGEIRASDGVFKVDTPNQQLQLNRIDIHTAAGGVLRVSAALRIEWPQAQSDFKAESIQIDVTNWHPDNRRPVELSCRLSHGALQSQPIWIPHIQMAAKLIYDGTQNAVRITDTDIRGGIASLRHRPLPPTEWHLAATGTYALGVHRAELTAWQLEVSNVMRTGGTAQIRLADPKTFQLSLTDGRLTVEDLLDLLDELDAGRPPLNANGEARFSGQVSIDIMPETAPRIRADITADWDGMALFYQNSRHHLKTKVRGHIRAEADLLNPLLQVQLDADALSYQNDRIALSHTAASIAATGQYSNFELRFDVDIGVGELTVGKRRFRLETISLQAEQARFQLKNHRVDIPRMRIYSPAIGRLKSALGIDPSKLKMTLSGENNRLLAHMAQNYFLPSGWRLNARERFDVVLERNAHQSSRLSAEIHLMDVGFSNANGSRVAEGIQTRVDVVAERHTRHPNHNARIQLTVPEGEMLWDNHYLSFETHPLAIESNGTLDTVASSLQLDRLIIDVRDLLSALITGRLSVPDGKPLFDISIRLPATDLSPLFHYLVSEPYKFQYPAMAALEVGGTIAGNLNLKRERNGWAGRGQLLLREGGVRQAQSGIVLEGIELALPIRYQKTAHPESTSPSKGSLHVRQLTLPFVPTQALRLHFDVYPHRLVIEAPTALVLRSGRAVFGPTRIDGLFSGNKNIQTSLVLEAVALDPYLEDWWPTSTGGVLQGSLTKIRLDQENFIGRGNLTAHVFGGAIRLQDPEIKNPFGSAPILVLDSRIINFDLGKLTENTTFGKIEGTLQGRIENLEIANGQTQRFDLMLETVKREGVPRKINVRAIENIASLGGGQNPFVGMAGKAVAVFDQFYYQKIGVKASLRNDVFRINGTLHEGDKEYLVKKGGIPGVDVVNLNPDNRISFKDMLKRIQRIRSNQGGAVIR